ncbi:hypothetical protein Ancab_019038 [Ancistrocladus abbreviatus]
MRVMELEKNVKHGDLPFLCKDIYNFFNKICRDNMDNDAMNLLEYCKNAKGENSSFQYAFTVDEENRLEHVFWSPAHCFDWLYMLDTIDDFEHEWSLVISKFNLQANKHINGLYEVKQYWVPTYLRDHFFGGISIIEGSSNDSAGLGVNDCIRIPPTSTTKGRRKTRRIVKSEPSQLVPQGPIAVIGGARANDESGSVHMGSSALPQDVTGRLNDSGGFSGKHKGHNLGQALIRALCSDDDQLSDTLGPTECSSLGSPNKAHSQSHGFEAPSNGAGEKDADLAGPSSIKKPSAGHPHIKLVSRPTKHAQKKLLEDILQLRLSKRVIRKGKKNRKVELTNSIGDDTGVNLGTSASGDSLHDSHIMNRNQVLMAGNEHLGNGSPRLSPSAICAVLSQLGVVKDSNVKETVQRIADMEMRDALLFFGTYKVSQSPP